MTVATTSAATPERRGADKTALADVDLARLAASVAGRARPGEQVEAYVGRSRTTTVRASGGAAESVSSATSAGLGVRVVVGGRQGFASAGSLDADVVAEVLDEARDNASFAAVDEANGLAEADGVAPVELDLVRPQTFAVEDKVALALALERAVLGGDPRIRGVRVAIYGDSASEAALATSTGLAAHDAATSASLSVSALAGEGAGTQTGYGLDVARRPEDLDLDATATRAVERATGMLGARQPASGRTVVVLEPSVAAALLGILGGVLGGEAVLKGRSPFAERVGETVAGGLTLVDDPTDARSLGAGVWDGEGLACRRNVLLADGVLQGFLHNSWSGRRAGTASTASAVRGYGSTPGVGAMALSLAPGPLDREALLASIGDGVLVQEVSGLHSGVNAVSGDVSVGAEGRVIRDGALADPFREATIASTMQRMLLNVVAVGADLEWRPGGTATPSLAIADVTLSGS
ncbi:TldD/PmbA family protein [soil metagenome]